MHWKIVVTSLRLTRCKYPYIWYSLYRGRNGTGPRIKGDNLHNSYLMILETSRPLEVKCCMTWSILKPVLFKYIQVVYCKITPPWNFNQPALLKPRGRKKKKEKKHTTAGIRWWSPTQLLISRSQACVWQSGRDAQYS